MYCSHSSSLKRFATENAEILASHNSDAQPIESRCREYNTRGVDITIVVIRVLFSYGYTLKCDSTTSKRVKAILEVASRDLGFDQSSDWKLKRHIYTAWGRNPGTSHTFTFRYILWEPRLNHVLAYHAAFQLVSFHAFIQRETSRDFEYKLLEKANQIFQWKNTPRYSGQSPLSEFIWSHFQPYPLDGVTYQLTGPEFLLVRYTVREAPGQTIQHSAPSIAKCQQHRRLMVNGFLGDALPSTSCVWWSG
ncbi:hypothetical protein BGZ57DRAFT_1001900 [Hyaloscypha finlandica]|nr:hypothetical protein BGZ57DRAFT_1001900 [Hyaloscypha finlandica]